MQKKDGDKYNYPVVTMGTFDGVHLGHQHLIRTVRKRALQNEGTSIVLTYYHHPKEILNHTSTPCLLTEKENKEALIKGLGVDKVYFLEFDYNMSLMSADDFLKKYLCGLIGAKEIVFGYDCHFGHKRAGNYSFLESRKDKYNYKPLLIEPIKVGDRIVSSTLIRYCLTEGDIEKANLYLGRSYEVLGVVEEGKRLGRVLGFPTLNVKKSEPLKLLPRTGVYIGKVSFGNNEYFCLTNVGYAPTLKINDSPLIECHLLYKYRYGYNGNISVISNFGDGQITKKDSYGKQIKVEFVKRIRDELKFSRREELIAAIKKDKEFAVDYIDKVYNGSSKR